MDKSHSSSNPNSGANSPHTPRAKSEDRTAVISSDDSITVVEINRDDTGKSSTLESRDTIDIKETEIVKDNSAGGGHENKAFVHNEETTSGSSSGSSTSSPEPPVNFELKDMSPHSQPKIMCSNSMEKVAIDQTDGYGEKNGRCGDDYLISINEHQKTGLK